MEEVEIEPGRRQGTSGDVLLLKTADQNLNLWRQA